MKRNKELNSSIICKWTECWDTKKKWCITFQSVDFRLLSENSSSINLNLRKMSHTNCACMHFDLRWCRDRTCRSRIVCRSWLIVLPTSKAYKKSMEFRYYYIVIKWIDVCVVFGCLLLYLVLITSNIISSHSGWGREEQDTKRKIRIISLIKKIIERNMLDKK